ncbi:hypothetical protein GGE50_003834 [Rhizobium leguminosarum]|uniref:PD-(D/E)XK nuclease domain-containing protein n=1 Tax=Rhizobium leguminosarum TaxID=384 RepID=UPI00161BBCBB|nr:hypothetical protein [Rhizobium leguminosarum]MBB4587930.1 hypothetical protein [Rhizobium leguminosarum]
MGKEEQLLTTSIRNSINEAHKIVDKITNLSLDNTLESRDKPNPAMDEADELLEWYLTKLYREVGMLAERMQVPRTAMRIAAEFDAIKNITSVAASNFDTGLASPHLSSIGGYFESLATMTQGTEVTGLEVFRTILENTPAIIQLAGVAPEKESRVQEEVMKVLKIAFPGAEREPSISHVFKRYKPDFGVRSLMAAAEYKFADTLSEVKKSLDEIYTDMKGYAGHSDWRTFYAVIYTTDRLVNPKEIEAEFLSVGADVQWFPIVVVGNGGRKSKRPARPQAGGGAINRVNRNRSS